MQRQHTAAAIKTQQTSPQHTCHALVLCYYSMSALLLLATLQPQHPRKAHQSAMHTSLSQWLLVKVLHPTRHKIGHFGDALPSQSLG